MPNKVILQKNIVNIWWKQIYYITGNDKTEIQQCFFTSFKKKNKFLLRRANYLLSCILWKKRKKIKSLENIVNSCNGDKYKQKRMPN